MTFYQIGWFSSIFHLHGLVINHNLRFQLISWSSKNGNYIFQSLNHVDINLKPWFLIKNGYYIVPSPSTALLQIVCFLIKHFGNLRMKIDSYIKHFFSLLSRKYLAKAYHSVLELSSGNISIPILVKYPKKKGMFI